MKVLPIKEKSMKALNHLLVSSTKTFELYLHKVSLSKSRQELWHFSTSYNGKSYYIYCAPQLSKVGSLIKITRKKIPSSSRLIVICNEHNKEQLNNSIKGDYCLVEIETIKDYGNQMIELRFGNTDSES